MARRLAAEDKKNLGAIKAEAASAPTGLVWAKLGEAYASYGRYDEAIAAYDKALAKGGLKSPEQVKLGLGVALLRAGNRSRAKEIYASIADDKGVGQIANLWLLTMGRN
jgi:hypothetical protein